jgi:glucan biosynthesis protein C
VVFLVGYSLANRESLLIQITQVRFVSLIGAVVSTGCLFTFFYDYGGINLTRDDPDFVVKYLGYCVTSMTLVWCCLLTCLGYAGKYLRFSNPALVYLNEAVYPLFILHLTVIVMLGYLITPLPWSIAEKYLVITTLTVVICLGLYHVAIRPFNMMRVLFGVKPKSTGRLSPVVEMR